MDFKLELIPIAVTDVGRAIAFYTEQAGFHLDHDHRVDAETRFVQITPPGSACSIAFGTGQAAGVDRQAQLQVVVDDVHAAREELLGRGVDPGEVQDFPWGSFVFFADPDGNRWAVQQIPQRG
jgi:predicted enzyme related to lactoylglutathione lyase